MSEEEIDLTPKLNCGIWTAIENFINKENNEMIWDCKNVPPKTTVTRKKEKPRVSRKVLPVITTLVPQHKSTLSRRGSGSSLGRLNLAPNVNAFVSACGSASVCTIANDFAHKALILRKSKNEHAEEVFDRSKQLLESCNISTIDCSFNLPRVNAQLERLMGSNVVHLTDRKYMIELRRRITEDFESMLMKRIDQRKAEEIQRQRVLLMEGKLLRCPKELRNHPVLIINESTNNFVIKRRAKLKTERERVSERIMRLGKKWEAEHLLWEERERQNEAEMKVKEMQLLASDKNYIEHLESSNGRKNFEKCLKMGEMNMNDFLQKEKQLMLNRLKPKEKKFVPFTKDIRMVDAKRRMSEASISKLKLIAAKVRASNTIEDEGDEDTEGAEGGSDSNQADSESHSQTESKSSKSKKAKGLFSFLKSKFKKADAKKKESAETAQSAESSTSQDDTLYNVQVIVDPVIGELKSAKNVKDLYQVAEKIVGVNIENILDKSKSGEGEDAAA